MEARGFPLNDIWRWFGYMKVLLEKEDSLRGLKKEVVRFRLDMPNIIITVYFINIANKPVKT